MDPNAALRELRKLAAHDWTGWESPEAMEPTALRKLYDDHIRMCDLVEGLDGWIAAGGFLPERWAAR